MNDRTLISKDVAAGLRMLADDLRKKPFEVVDMSLLQQALRGGAAEIEQLRARLQNETKSSAATDALRTALTAISEATDLLECARAADNLESATAEDWESERQAWFGRNRLGQETESAPVGGWLCSCGTFNVTHDGPCKQCRLPVDVDPTDSPELL